MEEEHEMCPTCKTDIPVANYHTHTLHCRRKHTAKQADKEDEAINALKICDQCQIGVEASKMEDHRTMLCPKLLLVCKYCEVDVPASEMSDHESACGDIQQQCMRCGGWIMLRDWEKHQNQRHGLMVQKSPNRQRKQSSAQALPTIKADTTTMLPCEFCEGLVPIEKLLEHQAECVNPTNVRGSASLRNSSSVSNFHAGGLSLLRSHSMHSSSYAAARPTAAAAEPPLARSSSSAATRYTHRNSNREPSPGYGHEDNMRPHSSYSFHHHLNGSTSISRTSSVREARATTEERSLRGLYRQSSFTERSYARRAESLSRQSSFSRSSSRYYTPHYTSDYVSASRRSTLFDGYQGFAIYSSISQGLDEISYGGRLSRRNSVTESTYSRRGSSSSGATNNGPSDSSSAALPGLLAAHEAATKKEDQGERERRKDNECSNNDGPRHISRQSSYRQNPPPPPSRELNKLCTSASESGKKEATMQASKPKVKLTRKVSFTEREPVIIQSTEAADNQAAECVAVQDDEPRKPRRKKEKEKTKKKTKRDRTQDRVKENVTDRRKSQPLGDELFEQVSSKLKVIEKERRNSEIFNDEKPNVLPQQTTQLYQQPTAVKLRPTTKQHERPEDIAFGESSSSSKAMTSSESSPPQKPRGNRNSGLFSFGGGGDDNPVVRRRDASHSESKSSSKRNSLDAKTVQGLAQDLAAECAKAYALMESSLSKLSTEFGVGGGSGGPFGLTPRNKKTRNKSRPTSQAQ